MYNWFFSLFSTKGAFGLSRVFQSERKRWTMKFVKAANARWYWEVRIWDAFFKKYRFVRYFAQEKDALAYIRSMKGRKHSIEVEAEGLLKAKSAKRTYHD